MDSALKMLMDATARVGSASAKDRVSGIRDLVAAVEHIKALPPEEQVALLTDARHGVEELKQRIEAATAEYEEARGWLEVLEGVVRERDVAPGPAVDDRAERSAATVLAQKPDIDSAAGS